MRHILLMGMGLLALAAPASGVYAQTRPSQDDHDPVDPIYRSLPPPPSSIRDRPLPANSSR